MGESGGGGCGPRCVGQWPGWPRRRWPFTQGAECLGRDRPPRPAQVGPVIGQPARLLATEPLATHERRICYHGNREDTRAARATRLRDSVPGGDGRAATASPPPAQRQLPGPGLTDALWNGRVDATNSAKHVSRTKPNMVEPEGKQAGPGGPGGPGGAGGTGGLLSSHVVNQCVARTLLPPHVSPESDVRRGASLSPSLRRRRFLWELRAGSAPPC